MQRNYVTIWPLNREDSVLYFPPESFGPFRVLHQIGAGTLGPVFRAHEPAGQHRDRLVAIKVFRLDLTPQQASALVDELNALVAADIVHPNIAAPIAAGLEHGTAYLAQQYAVGESLDVVLRERGPISIADTVTLVESLASAIDRAAARGVHHGALHMRDILIAADGARITGFGLTAALTKIGAKRPTRPQYSSPDAPSDVYSLGTIAFEAVTGKRVSPDNLAAFEQQYGVELRSAFGVALAANPEMRPDRASDFAAVLRDAADMTAEAEVNSAAVGGAPEVAIPAAITPLAAAGSDVAAGPVADDEPTLDLPIHRPPEVHAPQPVEDPIDDFASVELPPPSAPRWSPPAVRLIEPHLHDEPANRWPMLVMALVFLVLAGLSVAFFLRSPGPSTADEAENAVDETTVDLPKGAPSAPAPAPPAATKPEPAREPARSASAPAPAPSRAASGAVRRPQTGNLLVRTTPADADVTVNGVSRGKTPLVLREVALGSYTIRIARDGYASEEHTLQLTTERPTFSTTINLRPASASASARSAPADRSPARGASASARGISTSAPSTSTSAPGASVDKPAGRSGAMPEKAGAGGLNVQSRPAGARVYVNDRLAGSTPVAVPGVPAGSATVRIELDGYMPWTTTVNVNAGEQTKVGASLDRK